MKKQRTVRGTINFLNKNGVKYLDFTAFNEEEFSQHYVAQYETLYNKVIVNKLFKHFDILPFNNDVIFNFFGREDNSKNWYGVFYEPEELTFDLNKVLKGDYSGLEELKNYSAANKVH